MKNIERLPEFLQENAIWSVGPEVIAPIETSQRDVQLGSNLFREEWSRSMVHMTWLLGSKQMIIHKECHQGQREKSEWYLLDNRSKGTFGISVMSGRIHFQRCEFTTLNPYRVFRIATIVLFPYTQTGHCIGRDRYDKRCDPPYSRRWYYLNNETIESEDSDGLNYKATHHRVATC